MQFILTGYDGTDTEAINRRMAVREEHLSNVRKLKKSGNFIWGGAIIDDDEKMIGSVVLYEFESRSELDNMLKTEPYILGGVWKEIEIEKFRLAGI